MTELVLRAPRVEDVPALTAMANLPGVRTGTLRLPHTGEDLMRRRVMEPTPGAHPVVAALGRDPVAMGTLLRASGRRSHSGDVFLMVHDDHWGRGIGRRLLAELTGLADDWLGLQRLQLEVSVANERAIRLYRSAGFEIEGTLRGDTIREGRLEDSHVMGRLRPAPTRRG
jgi:putative acetyltransferase